MSDRIFVEWSDGTWLSSAYGDFQAALAEQVATSGRPTLVEFRAAGEGYAPPTPCEHCGLSLAECACEDHPVRSHLPQDLLGLPYREVTDESADVPHSG